VVHAPFEWRRDLHTAIQPDVLVARFDDLRAEGGKFLVTAPMLAVEVLSPSTRRFDRLVKLSVYEESGVEAYWLVDPDLTAPSVTILERAGDRLVQTAEAVGDDEVSVDRPFPVRFRPGDLVADLRER
jgi:Uma2 family endonuclease